MPQSGIEVGDLWAMEQTEENKQAQKRRSSGLERLVKRKLWEDVGQVGAFAALLAAYHCPKSGEVGATGFEPATPWSQTRCATNCATPRGN